MPFDAGPAVKALQTFWYDSGFGGLYHWVDSNVPEIVKEVAALFPNVPNLLELYQQTERWWNSANAIGALIDYMLTTGDKTYSSVLDNIPTLWQPTPLFENAGDFDVLTMLTK